MDLRASAAALGREIEAGRLDPLDLAEAYLDAIAAHPEGATAYVRTTPERARGEAAAARTRAREGRRVGPLDGVPVSWKDLIDVAGVPCEAGTLMMTGRRPDRDAPVVTAATQAGLVGLGKTHLSELAFSGLGVNPKTATAPNPAMPGHAPGGSSSGSAASMPLGLAAATVGSDTGGSVRIPAAWQGLVGLKTTAGLISTEGTVPLSPTLDTLGPLTRTVEDAGLVLGALTGRAWEVPQTALGDVAMVVPDSLILDDADDAVVRAFHGALDHLRRAGADIRDAAVPELRQTAETAAENGVANVEGWEVHGRLIEANPGIMFPPIEARFRSGADVTPEVRARTEHRYAELRAAADARLNAEGFWLMPTSPILPPPVARLLADEAYFAERNMLALRNTRLGNYLRLAAITVPTPAPAVGLMVMGPGGSEAALLGLGAAIERAFA